MKNKLKRIAASVLTLALLAVPVLAAAEPVRRQQHPEPVGQHGLYIQYPERHLRFRQADESA